MDRGGITIFQEKTITLFSEELQTGISVASTKDLVLVANDGGSHAVEVDGSNDFVIESLSVNLQQVHMIWSVSAIQAQWSRATKRQASSAVKSEQAIAPAVPNSTGCF